MGRCCCRLSPSRHLANTPSLNPLNITVSPFQGQENWGELTKITPGAAAELGAEPSSLARPPPLHHSPHSLPWHLPGGLSRSPIPSLSHLSLGYHGKGKVASQRRGSGATHTQQPPSSAGSGKGLRINLSIPGCKMGQQTQVTEVIQAGSGKGPMKAAGEGGLWPPLSPPPTSCVRGHGRPSTQMPTWPTRLGWRPGEGGHGMGIGALQCTPPLRSSLLS